MSLRFDGGGEPDEVNPSLWRVRARGGSVRKVRNLPEPYFDDGFYVPPHLTWLPRR